MRIKTLAAAAITAVAGLAVAAGPAPAADTVRGCSLRVYGPDTPVWVTSARNMTCKAAKREQKRHKWTGESSYTTPGGFKCNSVGRGEVGFQLRCVKNKKAYRIEVAD